MFSVDFVEIAQVGDKGAAPDRDKCFVAGLADPEDLHDGVDGVWFRDFPTPIRLNSLVASGGDFSGESLSLLRGCLFGSLLMTGHE